MRTFKSLAFLALSILFGGCSAPAGSNTDGNMSVDGGNADGQVMMIDRPVPTDHPMIDLGSSEATLAEIGAEVAQHMVDANGDLPMEMVGVPFDEDVKRTLCERWFHLRDDGDTRGTQFSCRFPDADGTVAVYAPRSLTGSLYRDGRCAGRICGQRLRSSPSDGCLWTDMVPDMFQFTIRCAGLPPRIIERIL